MLTSLLFIFIGSQRLEMQAQASERSLFFDADVFAGDGMGKFEGFGMEVYAYDAFCPAEVIEQSGVHAVSCGDDLFKTCDVVSLHIPATPETKQSINYAMVNQMKKGGILVNTARKEVINEPELLKLMAEREDLKFVTDIKPDADADFSKYEGRYFSTPKKMGAQTAEANINAGIAAAKQINAFFKDGCTKFQVNK